MTAEAPSNGGTTDCTFTKREDNPWMTFALDKAYSDVAAVRLAPLVSFMPFLRCALMFTIREAPP